MAIQSINPETVVAPAFFEDGTRYILVTEPLLILTKGQRRILVELSHGRASQNREQTEA